MDIEKLYAIEKKTGDSFYILRMHDFENNFQAFADAFRRIYANTNLGYSLKTNYIPYVCRRACEMGGYAEIVSPLELEIVQKLNISGDKVIYNGPVMDYKSLSFCIASGSKINIDNNTELKLVVDYLDQNPGATAELGVRLNFDLSDSEFSRFGFDPLSNEFAHFKETTENHPGIKLVGLHFHSTRRDKSLKSYKNRFFKLLDFYNTLDYPDDIRYFDLGGGFYGPMDSNIRAQFDDYIPTYEEYGSAIGSLMKEHFPNENVELILEPGLALTVNILDFYAKVLNIKHIQGRKVITVSGSFYNVKPSGHKRNLTIQHYKKSTGVTRTFDDKAVIGGFTCLENDILYHDYSGESIHENDYISFLNVGSYTIVFKPPFIKLAPPIIMLAEGGEIDIVRDQELFEDVFKSYKF